MKKANILLVIPIILTIAVMFSSCATSSFEQVELTPEGDKTVPESPESQEGTPQPGEEPGDTLIIETPKVEPAPGEVPSEIMEGIISDLVEQTGVKAGEINVIRAEAAVWNDGALGCPEPGEVYIQILVTGYWVAVQVEGVEYDYRVSDSGHFKLCEEGSMSPINPPDTGGQAQNPLVSQAKEDLAERLNVSVEDIKLLSFDEVVWPDASLGCPQPGMAYLQVPQDGALIRLGVERRMYFYHSGGAQGPFLCEQTSQIVPKFTPKHDELVPPPGSEID